MSRQSWQSAGGAGSPPRKDYETTGGLLRVVVGAAPTPAFGLVAGHLAADANMGVRDGLAVRVVRRLDRHVVVDGNGDAHELRYLPAAVVTAPDANLCIVLPEDWNSIAAGGFGVSGFVHEVERLESFGFQVRSRLSVARTVSAWGVNFAPHAEVMDLDVVARDVLRAGGVVQVDAGPGSQLGGSALAALAACGTPPWSGWVRDFQVVMVVPGQPNAGVPGLDGSVRGAVELAVKAYLANGLSGGTAFAEAAFALVDVDKMDPPSQNDYAALVEAVESATEDLVDVAYVATSDRTLEAL
jgi:hypothetical protein